MIWGTNFPSGTFLGHCSHLCWAAKWGWTPNFIPKVTEARLTEIPNTSPPGLCQTCKKNPPNKCSCQFFHQAANPQKNNQDPALFFHLFLPKETRFLVPKQWQHGLAQDGMAMNLADEILVVDPQEAMKTAMDLARSERGRGVAG